MSIYNIMTVSGEKAKKHLREFNKQIRKEIIKGISKMKSADAIKEFNKMFESFDDGNVYRPKKDFDELLQGKSWDFDAFKKIMEKKPSKPKSEPKSQFKGVSPEPTKAQKELEKERFVAPNGGKK